MADTPTTSGAYRKQGLGDRTDAWGLTNGLNGVLDVLDEAIHGFDALSIATTNHTLTSTNYTSNEARQRFHRFTNGGVSANPTVTVPAADNWWLMANAATGYGIIVSNGSNSITLSDGETALVATDGTNVYKFGFTSVYSAPDPGANGIVVRTASGNTVARSIAVPSAGIAIINADGVTGNPTLSLADDLSALEGLTGTGIAARTASNTWAQRTITAPSAGIAIADGSGVSGNPTLSLANDLLALENLGTAGMAVRTAADTWNARTITGTAAEITVTDGSGVSANPVLSLPTALTFTGKTVTGGTLNIDALTVDTTTLVVDATNNRVGIGTASPSAALTLKQAGGGFANGFRIINNLDDHYRDILVAGTGALQFGYDGAEFARIDPNSNLLWNGSSSPASAVGAIVPFNGTAPTGSVANGFAMYSADQAAGNAAPHFRTENGSIVILFEGAALTAADANALNTGDATSDTVIGNIRTRLGEVEARLQAHGLLA